MFIGCSFLNETLLEEHRLIREVKGVGRLFEKMSGKDS